jgi:membrane-bound ClpP family serine protease
VLPPVARIPEAPQVYIGQSGTAVSQLRPMGHCEFADLRIEAQSEYGIIEPGESVKVVAIVNGRPRVRRATQAGTEARGNPLRAGSDSMSQPT